MIPKWLFSKEQEYLLSFHQENHYRYNKVSIETHNCFQIFKFSKLLTCCPVFVCLTNQPGPNEGIDCHKEINNQFKGPQESATDPPAVGGLDGNKLVMCLFLTGCYAFYKSQNPSQATGGIDRLATHSSPTAQRTFDPRLYCSVYVNRDVYHSNISCHQLATH